MSVTVKMDMGNIDGTFTRYLALTKYDVEKGMLYQLRNWLVKAAQTARIGTPTYPEPAPALVAYLMSTGIRGERGGGKKRMYGTHTKSWKTIQRRVNKRKTGTKSVRLDPISNQYRMMHDYEVTSVTPRHINEVKTRAEQRKRARMQFYSREEARAFAKKHFEMRRKAGNFLYTFMNRMKQAVGGALGESGAPTNRRLSRVIQAVAAHAAGNVSVEGKYGYRHATTAAKKRTTEQSANQAEHIIMSALRRAEPMIVVNMEEKIAQKLQQNAQRAKGGV